MNNENIVQKVWNLCNILRGDGISYHEYIAELTYLLFLKIAEETKTENLLPEGFRWKDLIGYTGDDLLFHYQEMLNWKKEVPAFLDPFEPDDDKLLWFDNDGKPEASPQCPDHLQCKVTNSINIFHLHETKLVRKRNNLRLSINKDVKDLRDALESGDKIRSKDLKGKLRRVVRDSEMLSRAAVVYLRQHRDLDEVKKILQLD